VRLISNCGVETLNLGKSIDEVINMFKPAIDLIKVDVDPEPPVKRRLQGGRSPRYPHSVSCAIEEFFR